MHDKGHLPIAVSHQSDSFVFDFVPLVLRRFIMYVRCFVTSIFLSFIDPSFEPPSPKDTLNQVRLKLAQWFWRKSFLHFVDVFSLLSYFLPQKREGGPSFKQIMNNPLY